MLPAGKLTGMQLATFKKDKQRIDQKRLELKERYEQEIQVAVNEKAT